MSAPILEFDTGSTVHPALDHVRVEVARKRREQRDVRVSTSASLTIAMLAEGRGVNPGAARKWLHDQRRAARLVSVINDNQALVPAFQLDPDLDPRDDVAAVNAILVDADMDAWAVWRWWTVDNPVLGGVPIEVLDHGGMDAVTDAAERLTETPVE